ncbi:MAG: YkvA family protein [Ginsengibacter sp.]
MNFIRILKVKASKLKSEIQVLMIAYKDHRTPLRAKILIGITVGYLLSPIDLIPDFIPVIGLLDDLIIIPILISVSIKLIPATVLNDAREKAKNTAQIYKKTNWGFAIVIIIIWLALIFFVYKKLLIFKKRN